MTRLTRVSERVPPTGGAHGDAVRRALGKPDLPFWHVVLREALQNSWDARAQASIGFSIDIRETTDNQRGLLRTLLSDGEVPGLDSLRIALDGTRPLNLLVIGDTGTRGLAGPVRSDVVADPDETTDFTSFVFNVGRDPSRAAGGGTYGFGKAVFYLASRVNTVVIYSQTATAGGVEPRLIVAAVSDRAVVGGVPYTGRHWWGITDSELPSVVMPLAGAKARDVAEALGLVDRLAPEDTGTTLAVLDPGEPGVLDGDDLLNDPLELIAKEFERAFLQWFWPHLVGRDGEPDIRCSVSCRGVGRAPLRIDSDPEIAIYAQAYREANAYLDDPTRPEPFLMTVRSLPLDPKWQRSGAVVIRRAVQPQGIETKLDNKVALMRSPRMVVSYLDVMADPNGAYTAGVFIAREEMDSTFAAQEPVTHEAWTPEPRTGGRYKRVVARTLEDIREVAKPHFTVAVEQVSTKKLAGIAHLSRQLGAALAGIEGPGAELQRTGTKLGSGAQAEITATLDDDAVFVDEQDGEVTVEFPIRLRFRRGIDRELWELGAEPRIVLDSGGTEDVEPGSGLARVIGWWVDGVCLAESSVVGAGDLDGHSIGVRVRHSREVAVTLALPKRRLR